MKDLLALTLMACVLSSVPLNAQPQSTPPTSNAPTPKHGLPERLTVGGKFRYFAHESFVRALAGVYIGIEMAHPPKAYPPEWRQGVAGFARNYGDFMASWTAVQGEKFVAAAATHEDPR